MGRQGACRLATTMIGGAMYTYRHELHMYCDGTGLFDQGCPEELTLDDISVKERPTVTRLKRKAVELGWRLYKDQMCLCPQCARFLR